MEPLDWNVREQDPNPTLVSNPSLIALIREDARRRIAYFLLWILAGTLLASFIITLLLTFWAPDLCDRAASGGGGAAGKSAAANPSDTAQEVVQALASAFLTPVVGLIGAAVGFYFGGGSNGQGTGGGQGGEVVQGQ